MWLVSGLLGQSLPQDRVTALAILGWVVAVLVGAATLLTTLFGSTGAVF